MEIDDQLSNVHESENYIKNKFLNNFNAPIIKRDIINIESEIFDTINIDG